MSPRGFPTPPLTGASVMFTLGLCAVNTALPDHVTIQHTHTRTAFSTSPWLGPRISGT